MKVLITTAAVVAIGAVTATMGFAQSAKQVDDLPWWWADASDNNTVDIAGLPPGPHTVRISLVDPNHNVFPGQVVTMKFTIPEYEAPKTHSHARPGSPSAPAARGDRP